MHHPPPSLLADAIERFLTHRQERAPGTRRIYRYWLTHWRTWCAQQHDTLALHAITIEGIRGYLHYLAHDHIAHRDNPHRPAAQTRGLQPASVGSAHRTIRAFWRFCEFEDWLTAEQMRFFRNQRLPIPTVVEEPRPYCDPDTLAALLAACDALTDSEVSARMRAMLLVLYESGMRVGELANLDAAHVDLRTRQAQVLSKGNRWRPVFWQPPGGVALIRYVLLRPGGRDAGPIFRSSAPGHIGQALSEDAIRGSIKRLAQDAGIVLPFGCPVHWFRHSFAKRCLEGGLSDSQVSQLLGHRNLQTTARYTREYPVRLKACYEHAFGSPHTVPTQRKATS